MHISQPQLTQEFINATGMQAKNPSPTPYSLGADLSPRKPEEKLLEKKYPFAKALSILRYLVDSTSPDLAYISSTLARHTQQSTTRHWLAMKQIARYLQHTKGMDCSMDQELTHSVRSLSQISLPTPPHARPTTETRYITQGTSSPGAHVNKERCHKYL